MEAWVNSKCFALNEFQPNNYCSSCSYCSFWIHLLSATDFFFKNVSNLVKLASAFQMKWSHFRMSWWTQTIITFCLWIWNSVIFFQPKAFQHVFPFYIFFFLFVWDSQPWNEVNREGRHLEDCWIQDSNLWPEADLCAGGHTGMCNLLYCYSWKLNCIESIFFFFPSDP